MCNFWQGWWCFTLKGRRKDSPALSGRRCLRTCPDVDTSDSIPPPCQGGEIRSFRASIEKPYLSGNKKGVNFGVAHTSSTTLLIFRKKRGHVSAPPFASYDEESLQLEIVVHAHPGIRKPYQHRNHIQVQALPLRKIRQI